MLCLSVRQGPDVRRYPIPAGRVVLGSGDVADVVLPFPGISRRHALLERRDDGLHLVDLGSKNGLFLDGTRVNDVLLAPGVDAVTDADADSDVEARNDADRERGRIGLVVAAQPGQELPDVDLLRVRLSRKARGQSGRISLGDLPVRREVGDVLGRSVDTSFELE